jgi:hypothetical protein
MDRDVEHTECRCALHLHGFKSPPSMPVLHQTLSQNGELQVSFFITRGIVRSDNAYMQG